jgi:PAS domain S-box-containing protein
VPRFSDTFDEGVDLIADTLPAVTGGELDELLARSAHVARNSICITDADLDAPGPRIVYVNPAFEQMTGYRAAEVLGRNPRLLQGPATDRRVLEGVRADLMAGRTTQGETVNYRKDGTPFRLAWRIAAVRDLAGHITNYVAAQDDMTELRSAEQELRNDADVVQLDADWLGSLVTLAVSLARASAPGQVLDRVVDAATHTLGIDTAAVVLLDADRRDWQLASASAAEPLPVGSRFEPEPGSLIDVVLRGGGPVVESTGTRSIGAGFSRRPDGAVAALALADPEPYGALILSWRLSRAFRPPERHHLDLLARLTTITHRQTQSLEGQRSLASELQGVLLPVLGELPGLDVSWRYRSVSDHAVVGGDWYDGLELPGGDVALFVGDVVGHGAEAAALMGEVRFTTRGLLRAFRDPGELLEELDAGLLAAHRPGVALATLCAVLVGPDGTLRYSTAGHPHPVIRRVDGRLDVLDGAGSRILGASHQGEARITAVDTLDPGDTLVAFSDGAFESRRQDYDGGYRALLDRLAGCPGDPDGLCEAAVEHRGHVGQDDFHDDVVVLAVRRSPP